LFEEIPAIQRSLGNALKTRSRTIRMHVKPPLHPARKTRRWLSSGHMRASLFFRTIASSRQWLTCWLPQSTMDRYCLSCVAESR